MPDGRAYIGFRPDQIEEAIFALMACGLFTDDEDVFVKQDGRIMGVEVQVNPEAPDEKDVLMFITDPDTRALLEEY